LSPDPPTGEADKKQLRSRRLPANSTQRSSPVGITFRDGCYPTSAIRIRRSDVPEPHRAYLRSIRRGERPLAEVLDAITETEEQLARLRGNPDIPDQPDRRWVDDWLHRSYLNFWTQAG
jgi:hypothetical protein